MTEHRGFVGNVPIEKLKEEGNFVVGLEWSTGLIEIEKQYMGVIKLKSLELELKVSLKKSVEFCKKLLSEDSD